MIESTASATLEPTDSASLAPSDILTLAPIDGTLIDLTDDALLDDEPTDRALLDAHVAGDDTAFGALFSRHRDRLWTLAVRTLGHEEDAADALQEAMVSAYRRAGSFRGDSAVTTWLHRIVVNACLDRARWLSSRRLGSLGDAEAGVVSASLAVDDHVTTSELRATVRRALDRLNADQRAAIVLVDMFAYPIDEAAELLGCAPGTVKSRCSRGRAALREWLADEHKEVLA